MAGGFPSPCLFVLAWMVGLCIGYDATKDCTFEFYNRSVYGTTQNPGCYVEIIRQNEHITFDLLNYGAETIKLGIYQNYSGHGGEWDTLVSQNLEYMTVFAECNEPPILEFGTESCVLRLTGTHTGEDNDYCRYHYDGDTCHPDVHYVRCGAYRSEDGHSGRCESPPCEHGVAWSYHVDRVKGCSFFHNERNDSIHRKYEGVEQITYRFYIWNWDKPSTTDPKYGWLKAYDFFMFDFDEDGDYRMPDFFVRKVNNPNCTYFRMHLDSRRGWRPLPQ